MKTEYKLREIELYSRLACQYDTPKDNPSLHGIRVGRKLVQDFTSKFLNSTVLDLGCGSGRYFNAIENYQRIVGVDISDEMLHSAKAKIQERNIDLIRADIFNLPIKGDKAKFDVIVSIGVLGTHVPLTKDLLSSIRPLLKMSGLMLFTTNVLSRHWKDVIKRRVYELLQRRPDSRLLALLGLRFPFQPYAEISYLLRRKLRGAGYRLEKLQKIRFAAEGYVITASVEVQ